MRQSVPWLASVPHTDQRSSSAFLQLSFIRSSHSCIVPARMQVVLNGVARSCSAIHVRGTNLFLKIERRIRGKAVDISGDERDIMNGETFYLFVGTMAYGALGVLIAFAGTLPTTVEERPRCACHRR